MESSKLLQQNGGISIIITNINGKYDTLFGLYISQKDAQKGDRFIAGSTENLYLCVADLNEDGTYEVIITTEGLDYKWHSLAVYENKQFTVYNERGSL